MQIKYSDKLRIIEEDMFCDCGNKMQKVRTEEEDLWYCSKCDNEFRINDDGSRDVVS